MEIISIQQHDLEGVLVVYRDENTDKPYQLTDDMKGPFAQKIRLMIKESNLPIKNISDVLRDREDRQKEIEKIQQAYFERRNLQKQQKNKALAEAIISGDKELIIEALSK